MRCPTCEANSAGDFRVSEDCLHCHGFGTVAEPEEDRVMEVRDDAVIEGGRKPTLRKLL